MSMRFDRAEVISHKLDQNGYLLVKAKPTRSGVFVYHHADGSTTHELRHPDEVFKADSLSTLKLRPVVNEHPGLVNAKNTKHYQVGVVSETVSRQDDYVDTSLQIMDDEAIKLIMDEANPKLELSCGYNAETIKEAGEYNGEKYDHVQKNIVYNHVALVKRGRAGEKARIYLDSQDGAISSELDCEIKTDTQITEPRGQVMKQKLNAVQTKSFKMDSITLEFPDDAEGAVTTVQKHLDSAVVVIGTLEEKNDSLVAEVEKLTGKLDEMKDKQVVTPERLDELARERADLCGVADYVGLTGYEKMDNAELKRAIVQHKNKDLKLDGQSEGYVDGRYESIVDQIKQDNKGLESLANLKKVTQPGQTKEDGDDLDKEDGEKLSPRQQMIQDQKDLHKSADK